MGFSNRIMSFPLLVLVILAGPWLSQVSATVLPESVPLIGNRLGGSQPARVASKDVILDQFTRLVKDRFIGQDFAVDMSRRALRNLNQNDMLLLHFVGASGTGKTHLAKLILRSFFRHKTCGTFNENVQMVVCPILNLFGASQDERIELNWRQLRGVGFVDFLNVEDTDREARLLLEDAIERAIAGRLTRTASPSEPLLLLLDNFNMCKQSCEKVLSRLAVSKMFRSSKTNEDVSIANSLVLITSDLTPEGLRLVPGEDRKEALQRVLDIAYKTWGEDSLWNDRAYVVPFSPYSDFELVRILELSIQDVQHETLEVISRAMSDEKQSLSIQGTVKWTGRFVFTDQDKLKLVDHLHREIEQRNCRAFEKIIGKLIAATRRPEAIEERLLRYRPVATTGNIPELVGFVIHLIYPRAVIKDLEYTQNIVFKAVDDHRMVIIDIDDIDGYDQKTSKDL